jgi:hypothetical protein
LPLSRAASKVYLTVESVGGEQHAGQAQFSNHALGGGDLVALDVDFAVRQQDRRLRLSRCTQFSSVWEGKIPHPQ